MKIAFNGVWRGLPFLVAAAIANPGTGWAQSEPEEKIRQLEDGIRNLKRELEEVRGQVQDAKDKSAQTEQRLDSQGVQARFNEGVSFEDPRGNWAVRVSGRAQLDFRLYKQDDALADDFSVRRIRLGAGAAFNGDIVNSGTISIEGNNSAAIRLDAQLNGDLTSSGAMSVIGDNSSAFAILGGPSAGVTGDVFLRGNVTARGTGVRGLAVEAPIGGQLRINGGWSITGYHNTVRTTSTTLDADDLQQSGAAIDIRSSVAGGVTIEGIGVEDDLDDDGDGIAENAATPDTNDDATAIINVFGGAPAIHVRADPGSNIALGPTVSTYGLHVRGNVGAFGVFDGVDATAIRIEGTATSTVTTAAGIALDGLVTAAAVEADVPIRQLIKKINQCRDDIIEPICLHLSVRAPNQGLLARQDPTIKNIGRRTGRCQARFPLINQRIGDKEFVGVPPRQEQAPHRIAYALFAEA